MYPVGISTCGNKIIRGEALFRDCRDNGITVMELSPKHQYMPEFPFEQFKAWADAYGITLRSFHLPFMPYEQIDISSLDKDIHEKTVTLLKSIMDRAASIGIRLFIAHPGGEPIGDEERSARLAASRKTLFELGDYAITLGATIAVENLSRSCLGRTADELLGLIDGHPALKANFDVNHPLLETPADFIRKLGDKIVNIHVTDYDFVHERHWLPGEGDVDWPSVVQALREVGYSGPWLYEVDYEAATLRRPRPLTEADFMRNAKEILSGQKPTVIATERLV